jgi:hypothetical protein
MVNSRHEHDHELVIGGTTKRLDLMTDSSGKKMYSVIEDVPKYDQKIEWSQIDWTGGHGQYVWGEDGPNCYFSGRSIDTTQKGRVIPGPKINEVYQTPTEKDNFKTGYDDVMQAYAATYVYQTFTAASSYTIGSVLLYCFANVNCGTITVSIRATAAGIPTGADLCVGTINADTVGASIGWAPAITFGDGMSIVSGTQYAIVVKAPSATNGTGFYWGADGTAPGYAGGNSGYSDDSGVNWTATANRDLYFDIYSMASTALDSTPKTYFWSPKIGKLLCSDTNEIYFYANGAWTEATTAVAGVKQFVEFNGYIFAACGGKTSDTKYVYSTDGDTWTTSTLDDMYAERFLVAPNAAGTAMVLWKSGSAGTTNNNELKYNTSGINGGAQWSSAAYIGDTSGSITTPFLLNDEIMCGRVDNLYNYDNAGGIHALMDELKNRRSTQNFKYVQNWQAGAYFSIGNDVGELIGATPGIFTKMGPLTDAGDIDKVGDCRGISADTGYLYVALLEENLTHIYKGKPVYTENGYKWQWCPWVYLGANQCECIYVAQHSVTDVRLWMGYGTHTAWVQITDNPTTDANARFAPTSHIKMSYVYGSNPYWDKMIQSVVTETAGCDAGTYIRPYYFKNTDTSASALTAAITSNGINKTNLTTALTGNRFLFEIDFTTDTSTDAPQLLSFTVRGHEKPETNRIHECTYKIGSTTGKRTETIRSFLRGGRTSTSLIKFADLRYGDETDGTAGTDYVYCVMLPGYPREVEVIHEKGGQPELWLTVRLMEVNYN